MTRKRRRLILIGSALAVLAVAVALVLSALKDSIVFFNSPTDVVEKHVTLGDRSETDDVGKEHRHVLAFALERRALPKDALCKVGGRVASRDGSVVRGNDLAVRFDVTDGENTIAVAYQGILPDLFREGQGVVTEGVLEPSGLFKADSVLAKHDENYMPKAVADALKRSGHWNEGQGQKVGAVPQGRTQ